VRSLAQNRIICHKKKLSCMYVYPFRLARDLSRIKDYVTIHKIYNRQMLRYVTKLHRDFFGISLSKCVRMPSFAKATKRNDETQRRKNEASTAN
jgi:hypothetical protein